MDRPIAETSVTIRGVAYQIRGDADPGHLERLAAHVDDTMRALESAAAPPSPAKLAILASLTIADQYFQERESIRAVTSDVHTRIARLNSLLDEVLSAG